MEHFNNYCNMFGFNLLAAAVNLGIGGVNVVFGLISLCMALFMWKLWYNEEKGQNHAHKT